jgi:hypothetical protein
VIPPIAALHREEAHQAHRELPWRYCQKRPDGTAATDPAARARTRGSWRTRRDFGRISDREFDPGPHRICRGRAGSGKGEIVAAAVELRSGAATDSASIIAFCRERLASYKVPIRAERVYGPMIGRGVKVLAALPAPGLGWAYGFRPSAFVGAVPPFENRPLKTRWEGPWGEVDHLSRHQLIKPSARCASSGFISRICSSV